MTPSLSNDPAIPLDPRTGAELDRSGRTPLQRPPDERRTYWRTTVLWPARAVALTFSLSCIVLNISRGGARLRFQEPVLMPKLFTLAVERFGDFPVEWVGNDGARASIRFIDEPEKIGRIFGRSVPAILQRSAAILTASPRL